MRAIFFGMFISLLLGTEVFAAQNCRAKILNLQSGNSSKPRLIVLLSGVALSSLWLLKSIPKSESDLLTPNVQNPSQATNARRGVDSHQNSAGDALGPQGVLTQNKGQLNARPLSMQAQEDLSRIHHDSDKLLNFFFLENEKIQETEDPPELEDRLWEAMRVFENQTSVEGRLNSLTEILINLMASKEAIQYENRDLDFDKIDYEGDFYADVSRSMLKFVSALTPPDQLPQELRQRYEDWDYRIEPFMDLFQMAVERGDLEKAREMRQILEMMWRLQYRESGSISLPSFKLRGDSANPKKTFFEISGESIEGD